MAQPELVKRRIIYALAAAALGAAASFAGVRLNKLIRKRRAITHREDVLDRTISDTMDASDAVAKY